MVSLPAVGVEHMVAGIQLDGPVQRKDMQVNEAYQASGDGEGARRTRTKVKKKTAIPDAVVWRGLAMGPPQSLKQPSPTRSLPSEATCVVGDWIPGSCTGSISIYSAHAFQWRVDQRHVILRRSC